MLGGPAAQDEDEDEDEDGDGDKGGEMDSAACRWAQTGVGGRAGGREGEING